MRKHLRGFRQGVVTVLKRLEIIALDLILPLEFQDPIALGQSQIFRRRLHLRIQAEPAASINGGCAMNKAAIRLAESWGRLDLLQAFAPQEVEHTLAWKLCRRDGDRAVDRKQSWRWRGRGTSVPRAFI